MKTGNTRDIHHTSERTVAASMEPGHEDREYAGSAAAPRPRAQASMEPGHEDREYDTITHEGVLLDLPQWSPVMKTGNTSPSIRFPISPLKPQWSPVMKTGNTGIRPVNSTRSASPQWSPVMKTGNTGAYSGSSHSTRPPQWSPVMKTGNTGRHRRSQAGQESLNGARS